MVLSEHELIQFETSQHEKPCFMLFSPWCYGHHPTYLRHLIQYWGEQELGRTLKIVVVPRFLEAHGDVVELAMRSDHTGIEFVVTTLEEQLSLESASSGWRRAFEQYHLIVKYARRLQATQGLIMYVDSCQLPLVLGRKLPCPFSGIYFRPTFHYKQFAHYRPTWKEQLQHLRERFFLLRLLRHPQFKTLYCLDPFAISRIQRFSRNAQAIHLPDPIDLTVPDRRQIDQLRSQLAIDPDRQVLLAFGRLVEGRKGTQQLIQALSLLPPEVCERICLLLVGEPDAANQRMLEAWLMPVREALPIQIVTRYGHIPESEVACCFQIADVVLAPYQKHVGMSGVLLFAAAAGKPILSSSYGLMGELVRQHRLGPSVDTTQPREIAQAIVQLVTTPNTDSDRAQRQAFAAQHSAQSYANTLLNSLR